MRMSPAERFAAQLDLNGPIHPTLGTRCWLWTGYTIWNGYGRFSVDGEDVLIHRFAWEQHYGPVPDGKWVLHQCDVRNCGRYDHLFLGDNQANVDDKMEKGRFVSANALKTHCKRGHEFTPDNTLTAHRAGRACRTCVNEAQSRNRLRRLGRGKIEGNQNSRKTECKNGHPFTPENTRIKRSGSRQCRTCQREENRARARRKEA